MKTNGQQFVPRLYNVYCCIIQFMNSITTHTIFSLVLINIQNWCMMLQHLFTFPNSYMVVSFLEYIGLFKILTSEFETIPILSYLMSVVLLTPLLGFFVLATIVLVKVWQFKQSNNTSLIIEELQNLWIMRFYRLFFLIFQYLYIPIAIPTVIYILNESNTEAIKSVCISILVLVPLFYYLIEYHQLELDHSSNYQLARKNFPNNLYEGLLIYVHGITLILLNGILSTIAGLIIFCIRFIFSFYFPFYEDRIRRVHTFLQGSGVILLSAMLVNHYTNQIPTLFLVACILVFMLFRVIFNTSNIDYWRKLEGGETKLELCKKLLQEQQTFAYVFRQILFIERQTSSYRELLLLQVIKKRCIKLETVSRGGTKIINTKDLLIYQQKMLQVISNFFIITDKSIGLLKFMQVKDPKCQIFIEQIAKTVKLTKSTKQIIHNMLKINTRSSIVLELAFLLAKKILNDEDFSRQVQQITRQQIQTLAQKKQRKKLFNQRSGVIFLGLLEDVGKITKVSKNMKDVLGYTSFDLIGLSINQLMPFTLRTNHNETIINFLKKYSKITFKRDPYIKFYAYNKKFHLQQVQINYYFNMVDFSNIELSGLFKRVSSSHHSILLIDSNGNIQGWNEDIGSSLNLDSYTQFDCKFFNIFPLIPALIKYQNEPVHTKIAIQTLFFIPKDMRNSNLRISDIINRKTFNEATLIEKQVNAFERMLAEDEFDNIKIIEVQLQNLDFPVLNVSSKRISFKKVDSLKNSQAVLSLIKQKGGANVQELKSNDNQKETSSKNASAHQSFKESMLSMTHSLESGFKMTLKPKYAADYCFNDKAGQSCISRQDIQSIGQVDQKALPVARATMQFAGNELGSSSTEAIAGQSDNETTSLAKVKSKPAGNFKPILQRTRFKQLLLPLSILFIALVVYDEVDLWLFSKQMIDECEHVKQRNTGYMVFVKNSFNPNLTYIKSHNWNILQDNEEWMDDTFTDYQLGTKIAHLNLFYIFTTQVPSMLGRLALIGDFQEMNDNFYQIVQNFDIRMMKNQQMWQQKINLLLFNCHLRFGIIAVVSLVYVLYLVFMYHHSKQQSKIVEAFFKFEKADLDMTVEKLKECLVDLQVKCQECYFSQELPNIIKQNELNNINLTRSGTADKSDAKQDKICFDITQQRQSKISKKKLFILVVFVSIFLIGQVAFLIVYGVFSNGSIKTYQQVPKIIDDASKLHVYPNLQIAQLFRPVPTAILLKYSEIIPKILSNPSTSLPLLFPLLQTAPCSNCTFLYPLLATNFISFYSSFNQIIRQKKSQGNTNVTELFYSLDIVVEKVIQSLDVKETQNLIPTISLYLLSVIIFAMAGHTGENRMSEQRECLEEFLKYFNEETVMKNKHLSNIVKVTF